MGHRSDVDATLREVLQRGRSPLVITDRRNERSTTAQRGKGRSGVCPHAARVLAHDLYPQFLIGRGKPWNPDGDITADVAERH